MAVHTTISPEALDAFIAQYDVGQVVSCVGIADGISNTNYLLDTTSGRYILTLFEGTVAAEDLPYFMALMEYAAAHGVPAPRPVTARDELVIRPLALRPAVLVTFLQGRSHKRLEVAHCASAGGMLAQFHASMAQFPQMRPNALSLTGWQKLYEQCAPRADEILPGLKKILDGEMAWLTAQWPVLEGLPRGTIHGDFFPDNALFAGDRITGIIDFYYACTDLLAYDLAIILNAWCFEVPNDFNLTKAKALLSAYQKIRPLTAAEIAALPLLCRGAAVRFLVRRLYDWLHPPEASLLRLLDPKIYLYRLEFHQQAKDVGAYGLVI